MFSPFKMVRVQVTVVQLFAGGACSFLSFVSVCHLKCWIWISNFLLKLIRRLLTLIPINKVARHEIRLKIPFSSICITSRRCPNPQTLLKHHSTIISPPKKKSQTHTSVISAVSTPSSLRSWKPTGRTWISNWFLPFERSFVQISTSLTSSRSTRPQKTVWRWSRYKYHGWVGWPFRLSQLMVNPLPKENAKILTLVTHICFNKTLRYQKLPAGWHISLWCFSSKTVVVSWGVQSAVSTSAIDGIWSFRVIHTGKSRLASHQHLEGQGQVKCLSTKAKRGACRNFSRRCMYHPWKMNKCHWKGTISKGKDNQSSNHHFSGDVCSFSVGVTCYSFV